MLIIEGRTLPVNKKIFHIFIITSLFILGLLLFKVLARHYWLLFFIWLILPLVQIWIATDSIKSEMSVDMRAVTRKILLVCAIGLSIINLGNYENIRHSVGYQLIDDYRIVKSYNCESPENGYGLPYGTPPEVCFVEDLSKVAWYSKVLLYLSEWGFMFLVIAIPSIIAIRKQVTSMNKYEQI